ncbi:MAG: M1 family aminopeptidase [Flavobacteriales bacterium]
MKKFGFLFLGILCVLLADAQPNDKYGCYRTRNTGPKRRPLTAMEKVLLNESIARSDTFDIQSYHISLDVTDYAGQSIRAATTISVQPLMDGQTAIRFDLYQLIVDSVKMGEENLLFSYDNEILRVEFPDIPAIGETQEITVFYNGNPHQDPTWGGFYFESNYIYNLGIGLTSIPPNFGKVWYPCFDSFVERATYQYDVKSANGFRAHCQGTFLGETQLGGDTLIRSFAFNQPIPTHLSAIAVADYDDYDYTHVGTFGDIDVRLTAKSAQMGGLQNVMVNLPSAINACEYWYGAYPFERVGYVLTTDGALEIPTNIAYPQYMTGESILSNNGLLSHELGHHWWGDIVTPYNHNDMWLKEGPAEYSSHLMEEWMNGEEAFVEMVKDNHLFVLENAHIDDEGFWPLSPMPDEWIYGRHTYYKGASVMHNLRGYLGDDLFRQGMSGVQLNHAYETVTPEQFRDALEAETGYDLASFFQDQIFSPGFSTFVVDSFAVLPSGNNWNVEIYIQQKLRACPQFYSQVPLDVTIVGNNGAREEHQIVATGEFTNLNLSSSIEPAMIILNGHNRLNQARMDHEFTIYTSGTFVPNLPYVDFRFYRDNVVDSSLVRIEHIWSGPDNENLGEGIYEISDTHYWIVDGLWDPADAFHGRLSYQGSLETEFDYALFNSTEENAVLVYRATSEDPWEVYPDFTLGGGSLDNGDGTIDIDVLRKGQYAFANGDASVLVDESQNPLRSALLFPVPANDVLSVSGEISSEQMLIFDIYDMSGRMVMKSTGNVDKKFIKRISTTDLETGMYVMQIRTKTGGLLSKNTFEVIRN